MENFARQTEEAEPRRSWVIRLKAQKRWLSPTVRFRVRGPTLLMQILPVNLSKRGISGVTRMNGRRLASLLLATQLVSLPGLASAGEKDKPTAKASPDAMLQTMQAELNRAKTDLAKSDPAPYFLSYTVYDQDQIFIAGAYGALLSDAEVKRRNADVAIRVGSPELDNTHGQSRSSGMTSGNLPLQDDPDATARVLWELTDREYKRAAPAYLNVKTNTAVKAEEEDKSPDFSKADPKIHVGEKLVAPPFDRKAWEDEVRRVSGAFRKYRDVYYATVILQVGSSNARMVSSEGAAIETPSNSARLVMEAQTRADDGMDLLRVETFQAPAVSGLPSEAVLMAKADMEGHRQRDEEEGQTFTKKVGQEVLPKFLSVVDDPTVGEINGTKLAGTYEFDNEGTPSERVVVIQDGILKNFLTSRMPIKGFETSNGHGRNQPGLMPTGRQGNLIVTSNQAVPEKQLRQMLIDETKKQGKPYGLYFDDIQGGFTLTTRSLPQAFQVLPVIVYKVYTDGRPDELVRGVDIVGTPLAALTRIITTGDAQHVFNGICGAESGSVPVSAVAPAMLFSEMEVQKRAHGRERPPILPAPGLDSEAGSAKEESTGVKP